LFVGRVTPVKGISPLLEALARIEGRLEICGTGWGIAAARSETKRLGLQGRVTFAGWVAPQELDAAYRRARIVVVPSLWPEPFGLVGIEAMAHRRPVIGSATGGIPDWLVDGQTGLLVSPGDVPGLAAAMSALLQDPALCARMGLAGQAHAMAQFSEAAHVQALRSTYAAALDHRRQSGDSD
jgi:glycosyltransferase involved in cell wall biosynthesis